MGFDNSWAGKFEPLADKVEDTAAHTLVGACIICAAPLMLLAIGASALSDVIRGDSRKPHSPNDGL